MIDDNRDTSAETPESRARLQRRTQRFKRTSLGITAGIIVAVALLIIFAL